MTPKQSRMLAHWFFGGTPTTTPLDLLSYALEKCKALAKHTSSWRVARHRRRGLRRQLRAIARRPNHRARYET